MPQSALARTVVVVCLVLGAVLLGVVGWQIAARTGVGEPAGGGVALIGGPFALVDQNGARRTEADFRGQVTLVYFGYTYCPDVCPTELQAMSDAIDALGDAAAKVTPVFISVDPARDTVARLKEYAANFHPRLVALTGSDAEVAEAARSYRVYYQKGKSEGGGGADDYLMDHSGFIYVMGADGRYLTHFSPNTTAEQMAQALRQYL
jgi:cytochrome oxidase Cu insertion factor (SCO1/SenC/PrrC family)